ncbi:hypothetical protein P7L74_19820 [Tistrella mobilis]|uniref:hypothetical protein n=1 Tax=Tistrella mobilis TaxID=171437 RepID=UPI003556C875
MSTVSLPLRNALRIIDADAAQRRDLIRKLAYSEFRRNSGTASGGGDYYSTIWSGIKKHISEEADLSIFISEKVVQNTKLGDSYKDLAQSFLEWWNEKRRWINRPYKLESNPPRGNFTVQKSDIQIKLKDTLLISLDKNEFRIIYPYFYKDPQISMLNIRLGLWAMHKCLPDFPLTSLRLLDLRRSQSYGSSDAPFEGNEEKIFEGELEKIRRDWKEARKRYD